MDKFKTIDTAPKETQIEVSHTDFPNQVIEGKLHSDGWELNGGFVRPDGSDVEPTHWREPTPTK